MYYKTPLLPFYNYDVIGAPGKVLPQATRLSTALEKDKNFMQENFVSTFFQVDEYELFILVTSDDPPQSFRKTFLSLFA
jgi:hypothetical protein